MALNAFIYKGVIFLQHGRYSFVKVNTYYNVLIFSTKKFRRLGVLNGRFFWLISKQKGCSFTIIVSQIFHVRINNSREFFSCLPNHLMKQVATINHVDNLYDQGQLTNNKIPSFPLPYLNFI